MLTGFSLSCLSIVTGRVSLKSHSAVKGATRPSPSGSMLYDPDVLYPAVWYPSHDLYSYVRTGWGNVRKAQEKKRGENRENYAFRG